MRKQLSIFFAAVLVCMVHTGSWALWGAVPSGCSQYIEVCSSNDCGTTSSAFGNTAGCATYTAYKVRNVSYEPAPFIVYDCTSCESGYTWKDPQQELADLNQYLSGLGNSSCQSVPAFGQCKEDTSSGGDDPYVDTESCLSGNAYPGVTLHENDTSGHGNHPISVGYDCATFKTWRIDFTTYGSVDVASWSIQQCLTCKDGNIPREMGRIDTLGIGCYLPDIDCPQMCSSRRACPNHTDSDCNNSYPYCSGECCVECTERSHCPDDIDWTAVSSDGLVEKQTTYTCGSNLCLSEEEYRCKGGYHDSDNDPSNGLDCVANACSIIGGVDSCGDTGHCNTDTGVCVTCTQPSHCGTDKQEDEGTRWKYTRYSCVNNNCPAAPTITYQCKEGYHGLVGDVLTDTETTDSSLACYECINNDHCGGRVCNTSTHTCVECLEASDCGSDSKVFYSCTNNQCDCKCQKDHYLLSGSGCEIDCKKCPPKSFTSPTSISGETDGPNTAGKEDACYISYDGTIEDDTGWFTINGKCGWSEQQ